VEYGELKVESLGKDDRMISIYREEDGTYWARWEGRWHLLGSSGVLLIPRGIIEIKAKRICELDARDFLNPAGAVDWSRVIGVIGRRIKR